MSSQLQYEVAPTQNEVARVEDGVKVAIDTEVSIEVKTEFTPIAIVGIAAMVLGIGFFAAGAAVYLDSYPAQWNTANVEVVALLIAGAAVMTFVGAGLFFYGRQVLGGGTTEGAAAATPEETWSDDANPESDVDWYPQDENEDGYQYDVEWPTDEEWNRQ